MTKKNQVIFILICLTILAAGSCRREDVPMGVHDQRFTGSWRLVERLTTIDSTFTRTVTTISPDTTITSIVIVDTSFVRLKTIPRLPLQSITFGPDGGISSFGKETEYYRSYKYFRVDEVDNRERIGFIIGGDFRETAYQDFSLRGDSLYLLPSCGSPCHLIFLKN